MLYNLCVLWIVPALLLLCGGCVGDLIASRELKAKGASVAVDWTDVEFDRVPELSDEDVRDLAWALRQVGPSYLNLQGTAITDEALVYVAGIDELLTLNLMDTAVTPEGVQRFLSRAPKSFELILLPDYWDSNANVAEQLGLLAERYPKVRFRVGSDEFNNRALD